MFSRAFLQNNERKCAQVCVNEAAKIWPQIEGELTDHEKADFIQRTESLQRKIDIEKNKKTITKEDLIFGTKKKKTVDINDDDDFPDLDDDGDGFAVPIAKPKGKP